MTKLWSFVAIIGSAIPAMASEHTSKLVEILIPALIQVESGGRDDAIGDDGRAKGCLQITAVYVNDINILYGTAYHHDDAFDRRKAIGMAILYLNHYGRKYERRTGKTTTQEVLSRIHNGGPDGWRKESTKAYWSKIKRTLNNGRKRKQN